MCTCPKEGLTAYRYDKFVHWGWNSFVVTGNLGYFTWIQSSDCLPLPFVEPSEVFGGKHKKYSLAMKTLSTNMLKMPSRP